MRCPACGATNPDTATWCGQCYASLEAPPAREEPTGGEEPAGGAAPDRAAAEPSAGGFRRRGDVVEWQCARCESYTTIDALECQVCGTPLAARYADVAEEVPRNWSAALALSVVVPGSGHVSVGRYGSGAGRMLLFSVWLAGGLLLSAGGGRQALPAAAPLYLGAALLWAGSLVDLLQLQRGDRELLTGRNLLWLVVAVIVLSVVGMVASAGGAVAV